MQFDTRNVPPQDVQFRAKDYFYVKQKPRDAVRHKKCTALDMRGEKRKLGASQEVVEIFDRGRKYHTT